MKKTKLIEIETFTYLKVKIPVKSAPNEERLATFLPVVPCSQAAILYSKCQFLSNLSRVPPSTIRWSPKSWCQMKVNLSQWICIYYFGGRMQIQWERWPRFYLRPQQDQGWMNTRRVWEELALRIQNGDLTTWHRETSRAILNLAHLWPEF